MVFSVPLRTLLTGNEKESLFLRHPMTFVKTVDIAISFTKIFCWNLGTHLTLSHNYFLYTPPFLLFLRKLFEPNSFRPTVRAERPILDPVLAISSMKIPPTSENATPRLVDAVAEIFTDDFSHRTLPIVCFCLSPLNHSLLHTDRTFHRYPATSFSLVSVMQQSARILGLIQDVSVWSTAIDDPRSQ